MDEKKGLQLITITAQTKEFIANGKKYKIESSISADRYRFYLKESPSLAFGQSIGELFNGYLEIFNITNEDGCRKGDIAVIARDAMKGIEGVVARKDHPTVLRLCTVFINEESEDRRILTEEMISTKIEDWIEEGIDIQSFFAFASASIDGLRNLYETSLELISTPKKK